MDDALVYAFLWTDTPEAIILLIPVVTYDRNKTWNQLLVTSFCWKKRTIWFCCHGNGYRTCNQPGSAAVEEGGTICGTSRFSSAACRSSKMTKFTKTGSRKWWNHGQSEPSAHPSRGIKKWLRKPKKRSSEPDSPWSECQLVTVATETWNIQTFFLGW